MQVFKKCLDLQNHLNELNDYDKSLATGYTFITEIFNKQQPGIMPDTWEELQEYLTDGSNDNGVDLFYTYNL